VATLSVYVTPKSGRDELAGWRGNELHVRVTSAPEGGKANAAVCKLVAAGLGIPKSSVSVLRGETSRHKILEAKGADEVDVALLCGGPDAALF
jgi:uncharacterized protein